ncbi:MAG: hypothetical protein ACMXYG_04405 [Candidatus Woesearchaeota archaeon]
MNNINDLEKNVQRFIARTNLKYHHAKQVVHDNIKASVEQEVEDQFSEFSSKIELARIGYKFLGDVYSMILNNNSSVPLSLQTDDANTILMRVYSAARFVSDGIIDHMFYKFSDARLGNDSLKQDILSGKRDFFAFEYGMVDFALDNTVLEKLNDFYSDLIEKQDKLINGSFVLFRDKRIAKLGVELSQLNKYSVEVNVEYTSFGRELKMWIDDNDHNLSSYIRAIKTVALKLRDLEGKKSNNPFARTLGDLAYLSDDKISTVASESIK